MRTRASMLFAALLCLPCVAAGQQMAVTVQSFPPGQPLKPGTAVLLTVTGVATGQEVIWHNSQSDGDIVLELGSHRLFAGTAPGPRTFVVQVPSAGADPFVVVTFGYGVGEEDDDENPPITGQLSVVIVRETSQTPTLAQAKTINGLEQYLEKQGIWRRTVDQDQVVGLTNQPPAYLAPVLAEMKQKRIEVPVLAILAQTEDGVFSVVDVEPLPATAQAAIKKVEKHE